MRYQVALCFMAFSSLPLVFNACGAAETASELQGTATGVSTAVGQAPQPATAPSVSSVNQPPAVIVVASSAAPTPTAPAVVIVENRSPPMFGPSVTVVVTDTDTAAPSEPTATETVTAVATATPTSTATSTGTNYNLYNIQIYDSATAYQTGPAGYHLPANDAELRATVEWFGSWPCGHGAGVAWLSVPVNEEGEYTVASYTEAGEISDSLTFPNVYDCAIFIQD